MGQFHLTARQAAAALPEQAAGQLRFVTMLQRGSMSVELYAPRGEDLQTPHAQDELYIILTGHGEFQNGAERHPFQPGDVIFVPAGVEHRFLEFSEDFATWVVFWGPEGGESRA